MGVFVIVGVKVVVGVDVRVDVGVMVGVWVQVGAERIGPDTPTKREVRNFSTMPSRSAFKVTEGQILVRMGKNRGWRCSTWTLTRSPGPPPSSINWPAIASVHNGMAKLL